MTVIMSIIITMTITITMTANITITITKPIHIISSGPVPLVIPLVTWTITAVARSQQNSSSLMCLQSIPFIQRGSGSGKGSGSRKIVESGRIGCSGGGSDSSSSDNSKSSASEPNHPSPPVTSLPLLWLEHHAVSLSQCVYLCLGVMEMTPLTTVRKMN